VPLQVVAILAAGQELPFSVQPAKLDLPELQGEPEDISREKCRIAARQLGGAVMVEDTSLCFNALKGLPGVIWKPGGGGEGGFAEFGGRGVFKGCFLGL
jgi:inosine triphosphate pyrophosphatase